MDIFKYADMVFRLAGNIVAPPIVGVLIGIYIDNIFHTKPLITIALLIIGIITGLWSLIKTIDVKS